MKLGPLGVMESFEVYLFRDGVVRVSDNASTLVFDTQSMGKHQASEMITHDGVANDVPVRIKRIGINFNVLKALKWTLMLLRIVENNLTRAGETKFIVVPLFSPKSSSSTSCMETGVWPRGQRRTTHICLRKARNARIFFFCAC